jgi:hypothetical protein
MVDPNEAKFFAALETFADEIQQIFKSGEQDAQTKIFNNGVEDGRDEAAGEHVQPGDKDHDRAKGDAHTRPVAAKQKQYMLAISAVTKFLHTVGKDNTAAPFFLLAEAMQDLMEGKTHPLFKVQKADEHAASKRGRQFDTTETWRLRASLCVGIQYLIASGMEQDEAVNLVVRKHRMQLQKLLRPGSDLETSIPTWLKTFATDATTNEDGLFTYKDGMRLLEEDKTSADGAKLRQFGANMIKTTVLLVPQVIKI